MQKLDRKVIHSSILPNPLLKEYIGGDCKFYYLPIFKESFFSETIQRLLGPFDFENKSDLDVQSSIVKAKEAKCTHVKIPLDRMNSSEIERAIKLCSFQELKVVLQVCSSFLKNVDFASYLKSVSNKNSFEWVLDFVDENVSSKINQLTKSHEGSHFSIPVRSHLDWRPLLNSRIFRETKQFHLYFGYPFNSEDFLETNEVNKVLRRLQQKFMEKIFLPPKGIDLWDARVIKDFDMEPILYPCFRTQSRAPKIKYSVIIPTYNNQNHLLVTIRHLCSQTIGVNHFELIIVDDGSTDETQIRCIKLLESLSEKINCKYIYFPRERKRTMGDSQYRAGISRNLGVKNSEGEILCFLDSDILTNSNYLSQVGKALETFDVVQAKRIDLSQSASHLETDYTQIDSERDILKGERYWADFMQIKNWSELPFNWKYVCTHSLSLSKATFWHVGGIKRNYIYYGFEDTDLGYRLVKSGYKLHLLDTKVFHLFHENNRSEFMNLKSLRHSLLSRTAQIFYLHYLDEDIYTNLRGYMSPDFSFKKMGKSLLSLMTLGFLWKPKKRVFSTLQ